MVLARIGNREKDALAEINRAQQLDPLSPIIRYSMGEIHISARQYDEAFAIFSKLASEDQTFPVHRQTQFLFGRHRARHRPFMRR
jgi:predicted Zn-dependent protease